VIAMRTEWTGTASELLGALTEAAGERVAKSKTWPDSPRALAGRRGRGGALLRKIGLEDNFREEGRGRARIKRITPTAPHAATENTGAQPSAPSASSAPMLKSSQTNDFAAPDRRTVANDADGKGEGQVLTVRANLLKSNAGIAADGADANLTPQS